MPNAQEPCLYVFQLVLGAGAAAHNQNVPIDTDSDFMWTGIHGTSTGPFTLNVKLPSGRSLANNNLQAANLLGTANQPAAIGPAPIYIAGGIGPSLELLDISGAPNTLEIVFSGIRRFTQ